MLTLRTIEIETEQEPDSLLTNLQWNTERIKIIPMNLFFFLFKNNVVKQWLGQINRELRQFKILRNKAPNKLVVRISRIVINGHIITDSDKNIIKLRLQLTGHALWNLVSLTLMTSVGIVLIPTDILTENWWLLLMWLALITIDILILIIDLNKTENKLIEYFDKQAV
ncbi:MAG: hypothetical protein ACK5R0_04420 [Bacteroidota bacterium]